MLLYAESVWNYQKGRQFETVVDVATSRAHDELRARYGSDGNEARSRRASMIRLRYNAGRYGAMRAGSWYDVPVDAWEGAEYREIGFEEAGSAFLRAELNAYNSIINFSEYLARPRYAVIDTVTASLMFSGSGKPKALGNVIRLEVVDCGHGNWNQVYLDHATLIYDTGACRSFNRKQIRALIQSRSLLAEKNPLYIVISHWDVDHYQALLLFNNMELGKIKCAYVPSKIPKTLTYLKIKARLDSANVPMLALAPATKQTAGRSIDLVHIASQGPLRIFRATPGNSSNQTGIALGIVGHKKTALLTGDHHYPKLLALAPHLPSAKSLVLVTPHHGGHAGRLDTVAWLAQFPFIETPISCGNNQWNQPYTYVTNGLSVMQRNNPARQTRLAGTLSYQL